jgi:chorismate--pyruvate lyase
MAIYKSAWHYLQPVPASYLPRKYHKWVLDRGSLTQRLIHASQGQFKVNVKYQGWNYPTLDEASVLSMPKRQFALVREVELTCFNEVWVVARTLIPRTTLTGPERALMYLGSQPLGDFLFQCSSMKRSVLELRHHQGHLFKPPAHLAPHAALVARRSVFLLHNKPLLVSEFFLPTLFHSQSNV